MYNIDNKKIEYFKNKILSESDKLWESFLWRYTNNMYHALTAEIMLQRTRAEQVEPIYREFTENYNSPGEYLEKCHHNIFTHLGLPKREIQFQNLSKILSQSKTIPTEKKDLLNLPGVGIYVASAYRSLHMRIRDTIIDSNIVRLYGRFFGFQYSDLTRRQKTIYELSESITPEFIFRKFNYGLLDFTRKVCRPKEPDCRICPLKKKCSFVKVS